MLINRKAVIVLGLLSVVGALLAWWLVSSVFASKHNQRQILFEVWHGNVWTGGVTGFYIDSEGDIYTFSNESRTPFESFYRGQPPYTTSDLFQYYGNSSQLAGRVDVSTLNDMIGLIPPASIGPIANDDPLTPVNCASRDAGIYKYVAFLYDADLKLHTPVELYAMGDVQEVNLSEDGRTLHNWLKTMCVENGYFSGCNPHSSICRP